MKKLTRTNLVKESKDFIKQFNKTKHKALYGVTDGKSIGTYIEREFNNHLISNNYIYELGKSSKGLDFPCQNVDLKVTNIKNPQSSSPFKNLEQKLFGLGHNLLVFKYDKKDMKRRKDCKLHIYRPCYIKKDETGDKVLTEKINALLKDNKIEHLSILLLEYGFEQDKIPSLVEKILENPPKIGKIGLYEALQWRVSYK